MHVRTNTVRSGNRIYRYTQIVQSYRNKRGKPAHRVLASFKDLPPVLVDNLKAAIAAARDDKAVVVANEVLDSMPAPRVKASLQYLDAAVALQVWTDAGLGRLLERVMPETSAEVAIRDMVAALAVHRCIQPSSKIRTCRWYPNSALPELQGLAPGKFNNTRVHRALDVLDVAEADLQQLLPAHIEASHGAFVTLFLDVTDTWFVGEGPPMAAGGRTKDGTYKKRVGIALLCDHSGMPLQWEALPGNYRDPVAMQDMINRVGERTWARQAPFVMDRAMGRAGTVEFLARSDLAFITALPVDEFASYSSRIPLGAFDSVKVAGTRAAKKKDLQRIRAAAEQAGFVRVSDTRYVLDLGVIDKGADTDIAASGASTSRQASPAATMLRTAQAMQADLDARICRNKAGLARRYECSTHTVRNYLNLLTLTASVRDRLLAGEGGRLTRSTLTRIAKMPGDQQDSAFDRIVAEYQANPKRGGLRSRLRPPGETTAAESLYLRIVVHFNPDRFLEQRRTADEQLRELDAFVADLNRRLEARPSRRKHNSIHAEVERELRRLKLLSVFDIDVSTLDDGPSPRWHVTLHRNDSAWQKRRRTDGLNVFVTNPDLHHSPDHIVATYFAKDWVEKDFQVIKSELDIRPMRHRTDPKIRAHLTLCVLALLIIRTLERRLATAGIPMTAARCFEQLEPCRLNMHAGDWGHTYSVTEPTPDQTHILKALGMDALVDDRAVAEAVTPR